MIASALSAIGAAILVAWVALLAFGIYGSARAMRQRRINRRRGGYITPLAKWNGGRRRP